jgi:replication initiation protein RepC
MRGAQPTGWRALPALAPVTGEPEVYDKDTLFEAARAAGQVLDLPASCRQVLDQLCGFYRGMMIEGRMLVWPSNETLSERTGIPDRTIRAATRRLLDLGVIAARDSANGKRYAQRDSKGQIVRAYGFDLTPLLLRLFEWRGRLQAIRDRQRELSHLYDQLTIERRSAQEAVRALCDDFPKLDSADLMERVLELTRVTPRRGSKSSPADATLQWSQLKDMALSRYYAAKDGSSCRHIEHNKYAPDQSCNKGFPGKAGAKPEPPALSGGDLQTHCPDAMEIVGRVRNDVELIGAVARMRGAFGVSKSGWDDAVTAIGPVLAAATLVYVVQLQIKPSPGSDAIRNAGGYFRAVVRLISEGKFHLSSEIERMARRL